jgi:hypothetical protein
MSLGDRSRERQGSSVHHAASRPTKSTDRLDRPLLEAIATSAPPSAPPNSGGTGMPVNPGSCKIVQLFSCVT